MSLELVYQYRRADAEHRRRLGHLALEVEFTAAQATQHAVATVACVARGYVCKARGAYCACPLHERFENVVKMGAISVHRRQNLAQLVVAIYQDMSSL